MAELARSNFTLNKPKFTFTCPSCKTKHDTSKEGLECRNTCAIKAKTEKEENDS